MSLLAKTIKQLDQNVKQKHAFFRYASHPVTLLENNDNGLLSGCPALPPTPAKLFEPVHKTSVDTVFDCKGQPALPKQHSFLEYAITFA